MLSEYNSQEAEGSAFEEAMKSANNWQGKLNELSNTFTKFIENIVNSDTAITIIEIFNNIIASVDKLRGILGTFPTILTSIGTALAFKNVGGTNKTRPFLYSHNLICIENETRFKIRLSNCWDDYAKAL